MLSTSFDENKLEQNLEQAKQSAVDRRRISGLSPNCAPHLETPLSGQELIFWGALHKWIVGWGVGVYRTSSQKLERCARRHVRSV